MQFGDLPQDEEFANYKMFAYYQNLGFKRMPDTDYFYLNQSIINDVFDAIDIEEE